jgi:hypothetical protein
MPSPSPLVRSLICNVCLFRRGGCASCPLSAAGRRLWSVWAPPLVFAAGLLGAAAWVVVLWLRS